MGIPGISSTHSRTMRLLIGGAIAAGAVALPLGAALADDASPLAGEWLEQLPQKTLIFEFDADKMTMTPADADGKPTGPATTAPVKYERHGTMIDVLFQSVSGGSLVVTLDTDNSGSLIVPGNLAHPIARIK
jgi:hypothetical protein